jgi:hypothetical protein
VAVKAPCASRLAWLLCVPNAGRHCSRTRVEPLFLFIRQYLKILKTYLKGHVKGGAKPSHYTLRIIFVSNLLQFMQQSGDCADCEQSAKTGHIMADGDRRIFEHCDEISVPVSCSHPTHSFRSTINKYRRAPLQQRPPRSNVCTHGQHRRLNTIPQHTTHNTTSTDSSQLKRSTVLLALSWQDRQAASVEEASVSSFVGPSPTVACAGREWLGSATLLNSRSLTRLALLSLNNLVAMSIYVTDPFKHNHFLQNHK